MSTATATFPTAGDVIRLAEEHGITLGYGSWQDYGRCAACAVGTLVVAAVGWDRARDLCSDDFHSVLGIPDAFLNGMSDGFEGYESTAKSWDDDEEKPVYEAGYREGAAIRAAKKPREIDDMDIVR
jgi:hypothetical protein